MEITVRSHKGPEDIKAIAEIFNAADAVDRRERGVSERELAEVISSPSVQSGGHCIIAEMDGTPAGCALLRLREGDAAQGTDSNFYVTGIVHPDWRRRGVGSRIMEELLARTASQLGEIRTENVWFGTMCEPEETDTIALFEKFGLKRVRYFFEMVYDSADYPDEPRYPDGITVRTFRRGEDEETGYYARNESFRDHWNFTQPRREDWMHWLSSEDFDPSLYLLAFDESGSVAGISWNAIYKEHNKRIGRDEGWVDVLGVLRPYRKRGLGRALLRHSMRLLRDHGMEVIALGVDAGSLTGATRLYESVGFRVRKTEAAYHKALRGKEDEPID